MTVPSSGSTPREAGVDYRRVVLSQPGEPPGRSFDRHHHLSEMGQVDAAVAKVPRLRMEIVK
jgi:hypothetical protein